MIAFADVRRSPQQAAEQRIHAVPRQQRTSVNGPGFTATATRTAAIGSCLRMIGPVLEPHLPPPASASRVS